MVTVPVRQCFDINMIAYLDSVSKLLLSDPEAKKYPDVITFGFWCRKASITKLKIPYQTEEHRIGRGIIFHIAPSNVAVNFAYSLVTGLLSGNANIVRLPSKEFVQVRLIVKALKEALTKDLSPYLCLIQYHYNQEITDYLSSICDARIIWGGNQTIMTIRHSPLKPRSIELTFADRYSISVIDSNKYLMTDSKREIARGFYNDTYLTDQNACTSPRIIIWMGDRIKEAQEIFWNELSLIVKKEYELLPIQAVNKFSSLCRQAAADQKVHLIDYNDNYIVRIKVDTISKDIMDYKGNSGYFMEYEAKGLDEILPLCTLECQTLSYYGLTMQEWNQFIMAAKPRGVDRIVPIGKTLDFSLIWDGYDLIRSLTRIINY
jgi:hypothetical protein